MKKNSLLFMSFLMLLATIAFVFGFTASVPPTRLNFVILLAISLMGAVGAVAFFEQWYKTRKS